MLARTTKNACELISKQHAMDYEHGSVSMSMMRELFGSLLGPNDGPHSYDDPQYMQSIDLYKPYKNRVVPFFGDMVTVQVLNNRANFLSTHVCPIWETNEQNFTTNRKEFNSVPFTAISELGIPDEQTHFSYGWNDSVEKVAMNARISRDLALDENFGAEAWTDELAQFASNASLTVNINIIYAYLANGWTNIAGNAARGEILSNPQRLLMREAEDFLIFARDSVRGLAKIRNYEDDMPEMDTVIGPGGFMQYLRDLQGEAMTVPSVRPWSNPQTQGLMLEIYEGPDSFKSIRLGNRVLSFFELQPFMVNLKTQKKFQPLTTRVTLGQFHPPNPQITAYDGVYSTLPEQNDVFLFYQTKSIGEERRITLRERLEGCQYWSKKTKKPAQRMHDFVAHLNAHHTDEHTPWPFNRMNPHATDNINNDPSDYHTADMSEVRNKRNLHDMRSWRALPCGVGYDPRLGEYYLPARLGDFPLGQLPNEWVLKAVRHLAMRTRDRTGHGDLDAVFGRMEKVRDLLRNAPWTDAFVERSIDKNVVKILDAQGNVKGVPTSAARLKNFPGAHAVLEFQSNADGSLDLPDKDGALGGLSVPPGYDNGPGVITLSREAGKPASLWADAGTQARIIVDFFSELHHVAVQAVRQSDAFDVSIQHPWYQRESSLATLIDNWMEPEGPIFYGVPGGAESRGVGAPVAETRAVVNQGNANAFIDSVRAGTIRGGARITNKERALASVTLGAATDAFITFLYGRNPDVPATFRDFIANEVIEAANYNGKPTEARIRSASAIAISALEAGTDAAKQKAVQDALGKAARGSRAFIDAAVTRLFASDYVADTTLAVNLKAYEATQASSAQVNVQAATSVEFMEEVARPATWHGDYTQAPRVYLRAPLSSSEALRQYLLGKNISYVLPADAAHFYELPVDLADVETEGGGEGGVPEEEGGVPEEGGRTGSVARLGANSLSTAMRPLRSLLNASGVTSRPAQRDLFAPLHSQQQQFTVSNILQMGRDVGEQSEYTRKSTSRAYDDESAPQRFRAAVERAFRGPWDERRRFQREEIGSKAERYFFGLLMEAPNDMSVPVGMAGIGAELFGVMLVRPFIQAKTDALILTVAGPKTALYAFGHSTIQVTKEARGLFHLTCGFYHGVVRLNPDNIQLLLNAVPREFIGGKNVTFMTDETHFGYANPNKESLLAFLIPVSERGTIASPANLCNNETYSVEGEGEAIWERKCSAFGPLFNFIYREHNPAKLDASQATRQAYGQSVPAATVVHLGPTAYQNPQTGRKDDVEGVGPSGERVMNMPGAQLCWNGQSHRFPQRAQYELTTL